MNRLLILLFFSTISLAQVGIGTNTPDPAAVLDINAQISSTEYGGLKLPTVTIAQRALIPAPIPDGLMIYVSDGNTRCLQLYNSDLGNWLDVYCMNQPPVALSVAVNGTTNVGDVLSTTYDQNNPTFQTDNENDTPDVPLYQWYSNTMPSGLGTAIPGATSATYTIVGSDANNYLSLGITPQAATGASPGIEVRSAYTSQVTFLPTIIEFDPQLATIAENVTPDDVDLVFEFPNVSTTAVQVTVTSNDYSRLVETGPVTITIPANQTSPFTTTVFNILDNALLDGTANITFTITNVTGGLGANSIGTDDTDLWDITDDDGVTSYVLADWDFNGNAGNEVTVVASNTGVNVTSAIISRGSGINASNNAGRFNANSFTQPNLTGAIANDDYFEFTVTPNTSISVSQIDFNYQRSGTGPQEATLRSSADGFTSDLASFAGLLANDTRQITIGSVNNVTGALTFRLYVYGNTNGGGTGGFEGTGADLIITGTAN